MVFEGQNVSLTKYDWYWLQLTIDFGLIAYRDKCRLLMTVDGQVTSNVYSINIMVRKDQVVLGLYRKYLYYHTIIFIFNQYHGKKISSDTWTLQWVFNIIHYWGRHCIEADVFYCFSQNILFRSKKLLCWDITHREV